MSLWRKTGAGKTETKRELFEDTMLPHLDAAHNLARWLIHDSEDARDAVQEAYLRAFRFFDGYKGGDGKAWLLAVVRNTCRTWHRENRGTAHVSFDEASHSLGEDASQEQRAADQQRVGVVRTCIEMLPVDFREVLVMRELEEMSYREISDATGLALGTVMSRLSRARKRLEECAASRTMETAG